MRITPRWAQASVLIDTSHGSRADRTLWVPGVLFGVLVPVPRNHGWTGTNALGQVRLYLFAAPASLITRPQSPAQATSKNTTHVCFPTREPSRAGGPPARWVASPRSSTPYNARGSIRAAAGSDPIVVRPNGTVRSVIRRTVGCRRHPNRAEPDHSRTGRASALTSGSAPIDATWCKFSGGDLVLDGHSDLPVRAKRRACATSASVIRTVTLRDIRVARPSSCFPNRRAALAASHASCGLSMTSSRRLEHFPTRSSTSHT